MPCSVWIDGRCVVVIVIVLLLLLFVIVGNESVGTRAVSEWQGGERTCGVKKSWMLDDMCV